MELIKKTALLFSIYGLLGVLSVRHHENRCKTYDCEKRDEELNSKQEPSEENSEATEVYKSDKLEKKGCTSPMCWFRGGKRNSKKIPRLSFDSVKQRITQVSDEKCNAPMCWFRGRKRNSNNMPKLTFDSVKQKTTEVSDEKCNAPMCWFRGRKRNSNNMPKLTFDSVKQRTTQVSDEKCNTPMCWFRGRKRNSNNMLKLKRILNGVKKSFEEDLFKTLAKKGCPSSMCWFRIGREIRRKKHGTEASSLRASDEKEFTLKRGSYGKEVFLKRGFEGKQAWFTRGSDNPERDVTEEEESVKNEDKQSIIADDFEEQTNNSPRSLQKISGKIYNSLRRTMLS